MASSNSGGIPIKAEQDSDGSAQSTADMTAFVQNLLVQMQTRFQTMSENIITKNILINQFIFAFYFIFISFSFRSQFV
uniref:Heat shock factor-binding protein 1 n=1 Tax=Triticum urartu TaxID=4572 RepID=A0A8R7R139_TRIUA